MSEPGRVMFSAAEESFADAVDEIRAEFGERLEITRLGPDLGVIADPAVAVGDVAAACAARRLVFVRHLTVEVDWVPRDKALDPDAVVASAGAVLPRGAEPAVQVWTSGSAAMGYTAGELSTAITAAVPGAGRAGRDLVLSAAVSPGGVSIGLNTAALSLSDWPGGRVRLGRDDAQISRAEFKLEELFQVHPLELPDGGRAVDLGASPGGWTRILRRYGLRVWAVDPADLDDRLAGDRRVHHEQMTAGEFLRHDGPTFDVAVNDMRMPAQLSCQVMLDAADRLRPGAPVVVTLKLGRSRTGETVRRALRTLGQGFDLEFARQLHHNRQELTVVGRRR